MVYDGTSVTMYLDGEVMSKAASGKFTCGQHFVGFTLINKFSSDLYWLVSVFLSLYTHVYVSLLSEMQYYYYSYYYYYYIIVIIHCTCMD